MSSVHTAPTFSPQKRRCTSTSGSCTRTKDTSVSYAKRGFHTRTTWRVTCWPITRSGQFSVATNAPKSLTRWQSCDGIAFPCTRSASLDAFIAIRASRRTNTYDDTSEWLIKFTKATRRPILTSRSAAAIAWKSSTAAGTFGVTLQAVTLKKESTAGSATTCSTPTAAWSCTWTRLTRASNLSATSARRISRPSGTWSGTMTTSTTRLNRIHPDQRQPTGSVPGMNISKRFCCD